MQTWADSQKKVMSKVSEIPQDAESTEAYKRVWIDMFENDFVHTSGTRQDTAANIRDLQFF